MNDLSGLRAFNVCKGYGQIPVLRDFSLTAKPGTITALLGPNGSGKSTALRVLSLLEHPDQGRIEVDGQAFDSARSKESTKASSPWPTVTMVFQQLFLWPHLTVRQNIALTRRIDASPPITMEELIETFDLKTFADRFPNQISGGQRQRAALARALAVGPKYLLLDEATSALDVEQVGAFLSYLDVLRQRGLGIVIVTHLVGFARKTADQVLFLWQGRVVEAGSSVILDSPSTPELQRFLTLT